MPQPKPIVLKLLEMAGFPHRSGKEKYDVWSVCMSIRNSVYETGDKQRYAFGPWSNDQALISALAAVLADEPDDYPGQELAFTLVKCGLRDLATIARLEPWYRAPFLWHEDALTADQIFELLHSAHLPTRTEERVKNINALIERPMLGMAELGGRVYTRAALFGDRLIPPTDLFKDTEDPKHDELFQEFAKKTTPPISIAEITQEIEWDTEICMITFTHGGKQHRFTAEYLGSRVDAPAVTKAFNTLMDEIGHNEHAFRLDLSGGHTDFIIADRHQFLQVMGKLHVPVA